MAFSSASSAMQPPTGGEAALFPLLFLIGRPAAGKSEVIRYLKGLPSEERAKRLHIGAFCELDDFPMIWSWFEEDDILTRQGRARLHTDAEGYFLDNFQWNVLIERLDLEYRKWAGELDAPLAGAADTTAETASRSGAPAGEKGSHSAPAEAAQFAEEELPLPAGRTAIIEFARGSEHGGLREAFSHFSDDLLRRGAVLYIDVSFSESLRKNRRRFNPEKPHSILEHALPDEKLERMYRETDWPELCGRDPAYLSLAGNRVPYAVLENEDDVTTAGGEALGRRLEESLLLLWKRFSVR